MFVVTGVSPGHTVTVYRDVDFSETVTTGDTVVCFGPNTPSLSEVICQPTGAQAFSDGEYPVLVVATDPSGNVSGPEAAIVVADTSAPRIVRFAQVSGGILVTFSEQVYGRDAADDWYVKNASGAASGPNSVSVANGGLSRLLSFSSGDSVALSATSVSYLFGGTTGRYGDLAGNTVSDGTFV